MLNSTWLSFIVGTGFGILSGLGVGGGSLLVLWQTHMIGSDYNTAKNLNLLFFIPSALISSWIHFKKGALNIKSLILPILAGCLAAILGSFLSKHWEPSFLQKIFGIFFIITGLKEIFYRERNAK